MSEVLWDAESHGNEIELSKITNGEYELVIHNDAIGNSAGTALDRKHLKDLFNAIGNELNAWS